MNRKARRSQISEFILHSKSFIKDKDNLKETVLDDGSIKFYIEGFASTEVQDGSGDIVKVAGIDTARYEINPVIQRGHKRGSENTIGKTVKLEKVPEKGLLIGADIILNPTIVDHQPIIHGLRHGLINGFSIGFKEVEARYDDMKNANIIEKLELFEISLVDIPDNPLTVRKFIDKIVSKEGTTEEEEDKTVVEEVKEDEVIETPDTVEVVEETDEEKACGKKPKKPKKEGEVEDDKVEDVVIDEENPLDTVVETVDTVVETTEQTDTPQVDEIVPEKTEEVKVEEVVEETVAEVIEEVVETVAEAVEQIVEDKKPETIPENVVIPPVIDVDMDKDAKLDIKALQLADIKAGDMVYFRTVRCNDGNAVYMYPQMEEKPFIGYIFGIKTEGTALVGYGEFEEATPEEPLLYILHYQEVNGTLVPTSNLCVCCFEDVIIEGQYDGTMKALYVPEIKELEKIQDIPTPTDGGNADGVKTDEESEKSSGNAMKIKTLEEDKATIEKMLEDMITVNEKVIKENKEFKAIIDKIRKTKSSVGLTFEGTKDLGNSKIASIVGIMRG